jgi:2-amino-4-hydroxy-6-hydroxymethyldihydropteridine diphosphokinase
MPLISLSLGSNRDARRSLSLGLAALEQQLGALQVSPVFESEPVGFIGPNFLNLVVCVESTLPLAELAAMLKAIEDAHGRDRQSPRYSDRTLDIDILCYGDLCGVHEGIELPRAEILHNAYVLRPLAALLPEQRHPLNQQTFAQLWRDYDKGLQALWAVEFEWQGRLISKPER